MGRRQGEATHRSVRSRIELRTSEGLDIVRRPASEPRGISCSYGTPLQEQPHIFYAEFVRDSSRDHRVDLINMSLGAPSPSEIERDAIRDALERGTLCVCAAANSGGPVEFPAAFAESVAVSALGLEGWGPDGTLASIRQPLEREKFGSFRMFLANFSCFGPEIDCTAPGVGIISTIPERHALMMPYGSMDGTSMASPAACGALAVILSATPDYGALPRDVSRAERARELLRANCQDVGINVRFQGRGIPRIL